MKRINTLWLALLSISTLSIAQTPTLVKDINQIYGSSQVDDLFAGDDFMLFTTYEQGIGRELYVSNGTEGGTSFLMDINPGPSSSNCKDFIQFDSFVYFMAQSTLGTGIWRTDGTTEGTQFVIEANATGFIVMNDHLYFTEQLNSYGRELCKIGLNDTAITMVKDINPGSSNSNINHLTVYNNRLYFQAVDATYGSELWVSDGSDTGTYMLKNINRGSYSSNPAFFKEYDGKLYFSARDSAHSIELWITDGTDTGTYLYKDLAPGSGAGYPTYLTILDTSLFFMANGDLYKTNGDSSDVSVVKSFTGSSAYYSYNMMSTGSKLFWVNDLDYGQELYVSDGTAAGTKMTRDLYPIQTDALISNMIPYRNKLYFTAHKSPDYQNIELFVSDGSFSGTKMLQDINGDADLASHPSNFIVFNNELYFSGDDGIHGREIWKLDTPSNEAEMVIDITKKTNDAQISEIVSFNNGIVFVANDGLNGSELWHTRGSEASTHLIKDLKTGSGSSNTRNLTSAGDRVYFAVNSGSTIFKTLGYTDGTETGTKGINNNSSYYANPSEMAMHGDVLYFASSATSYYTDPWIYKGGSASYRLKSIAGPSNLGGKVKNFTPLNDLVFFVADEGDYGAELYVTDGTSNGTDIVRNINSGSSDASPASLTPVGNKLYFRARSSAGSELWISDGTYSGTTMVKDINPGATSTSILAMTGADSSLFFFVYNADKMIELWESEGSASNTNKITDIALLTNFQYPHDAVYNNGMLYFSAYDSIHGDELWISDGTAVGTYMLKDIYEGEASSEISNVTVVRDMIYFTATDGAHGAELWMSDGTESGTQLVYDLAAGVESSNPDHFTLHRDSLYFTADHPLYGNELFYIFTNCAVANFSLDQKICANETLDLTDLSDGLGNSITSYHWDFGNDSTSNNQSPSISYSEGGKYDITLQIENSIGCEAFATKTVEVVAYPEVAFYAQKDSLCEIGNQFKFYNQSSSEYSMSYSWDFGDGGTATSMHPNHSYSGSGAKKVTLEVTVESMCSDTASIMVYVRPKPGNLSIIGDNATNSAYDDFSVNPKAGSSFQWTIDKGTVNSGQGTNAIEVKWSTSFGTAKVSVIETDKYGCKGITTSKNVTLGSASVDDLQKINWNVYPNPANDHFTLDLTQLNGNIEVSILDALGKEVYQAVHTAKQKINIPFNQTAGVYTVVIEHDGVMEFRRLMVE